PPISWISLKRFWSRASKTNWQKLRSFINNEPMYSAPRCSMIKKHRDFGGMPDKAMPHKATSSSMPTSPLGFVLASPPLYTHTGGQLRIPLYIISGCSRSNMTKPHYFEVSLKMTRCKPDTDVEAGPSRKVQSKKKEGAV